jgi:hypothetical protein
MNKYTSAGSLVSEYENSYFGGMEKTKEVWIHDV